DSVYADNALYTQSGSPPLRLTGLTLLLDSRDPSLQGNAHWLSDGFFAQAFTDTTGNIIIAFEGSIINPLNSLDPSFWSPYAIGSRDADFKILVGDSPNLIAPLIDAAVFVRDVQATYGSLPIYLTGHSLGGAEAQYVAQTVNLGGYANGVTFGGPGILSSPIHAPNFINYVDHADPVGNFGNHFGFVHYLGASTIYDVSAHLLAHYASDLGLHPSIPVFTSALSNGGQVTLSGTSAEANDTISIYDRSTIFLGTTTTTYTGQWSFATEGANVIHTYTATGTDGGGNVGNSANDLILGSTTADSLF